MADSVVVDLKLLNHVQKTLKVLEKYVKNVPMNEKLLMRPPFLFLHNLIFEIIENTGLFKGLFDSFEMNPSIMNDNRERKIAFLKKFIQVLKMVTGEELEIKVAKILSGQEVEKTNDLLCLLGRALEQNIDSKEAVEKYLKENESERVNSGTLSEESNDRFIEEKFVQDKPSSSSNKGSSTPKTYRVQKDSLVLDQARNIEVTNRLTRPTKSSLFKSKNGQNETPPNSKPNSSSSTSTTSAGKLMDNNNKKIKMAPLPNKYSYSNFSNIRQSTKNEGESEFRKMNNNNTQNSTKGTKEYKKVLNKNDKLENKGDYNSPISNSDYEHSNIKTMHQKLKESCDEINDQISVFEAKLNKRMEIIRKEDEKKEIEKNNLIMAQKIEKPIEEEKREVNSDFLQKEFNDDQNKSQFKIEELEELPDEKLLFSSVSPADLTLEQTIKTDDEMGILVSKIMKTKQDLENRNEDEKICLKNENEVKIEKLKELLQNLSANHANPLRKLIDFFQEDIEQIEGEYFEWCAEIKRLDTGLDAEESKSIEMLDPLMKELAKIEDKVLRESNEIDATKLSIIRMEEKIQNILKGLDQSVPKTQTVKENGDILYNQFETKYFFEEAQKIIQSNK